MQVVREHLATVISIAEPLWTDPGLKKEMSVHELISTSKKKVQVGNKWSTFSRTLAGEENATLTCLHVKLHYFSHANHSVNYIDQQEKVASVQNEKLH